MLAAVVDESGTILERAERDLTDHDPDVVVKAIVQALDEVLEASKSVTAIGLGSPGNIDLSTGFVEYSPNFNWRGVAAR